MSFSHIHVSTDIDNSNSNIDDCNTNSENHDASNRACEDTCQLSSAHTSTSTTTSSVPAPPRPSVSVLDDARLHIFTEKRGELDAHRLHRQPI
ncbi:hypothetical protein GALMADRAFT_229163 [Galerina marginata CBS 339.88]|uniref:Uncharacterized protein n=1 Tax=Galerina marginata (strain CBS 339.88) TaxID=685588 RepID=A0A067SNC7_GALM3|nr:hypothetical protein GALMADRAFT_229163 [Galerina marginata CBS 339.88]